MNYVIYSIPLLLSGAFISKPITSENKVYDKIIKVLYLDVALQQGQSDIELGGYAPDKDGESGIVQDAIEKYTLNIGKELSNGETINQQIAISDAYHQDKAKFESFYHAMVTDASKLILPNTGKTSEELGKLWDEYADGSDLAPDGVLYLKEHFEYPTELRDETKRNRFHDNLKKDVMLIKAAFLQSYLIREEQNQKGDVDTELYRIQAFATANIKGLHSKTVGETFCNKRSRITRVMDSRLLN